MAAKPNILKRAFWNVGFEQLGYEANAQAVILRVLERGTYEDLIAVMKYYGADWLKAQGCTACSSSYCQIHFDRGPTWNPKDSVAIYK